MNIIKSRPPNYQEILAVFPMASMPGVIFAYAPDIYAPMGDVPPPLIDHEKVHIARQKEIGVDEWWRRYLSDSAFRYHEELLAHRAEYQHLVAAAPSRSARRANLRIVAKRLISPLYGKLITVDQAMKDILAA